MRSLLLISLVCLILYAVPLAAQPGGDLAIVATERLNLRAAPSATGRVIRELPQGTIVEVRDREGSWARVSTITPDRVEGWLSARYLSAPTAKTVPAAPPPEPSRLSPRALPPDPYSISDVSFDCDESYFDDGFRECTAEVSIDVWIPSIYDPFLADSVYFSCDGEVSYEVADGFMARRDNASAEEYVSLFNGQGSAKITLKFDFGYNMSPVVSARMESLRCAPR